MVRILIVNKMNEDIELLTHIYKNAQMGEYTTSTLINRIKNKENKIKPILEKEIKKYEDFVKRSKKILKSLDSVPKGGNSMAKISSTIGITVETLKDNSDSALAQMLMWVHGNQLAESNSCRNARSFSENMRKSAT